MPIDKATHPDYDDLADDWRLCRVVLDGRESKIKAQDFRQIAIPKLDGHLTPDGAPLYDAYVRRASWYAAASGVRLALYGAATHRPPSLTSDPSGLAANAAVEPFLADVTATGVPWQVFLHTIIDELLRTNRGGILVDYPPSTEAAGPRRPSLAWYPEMSIRDWDYTTINGRRTLSYVLLQEQISVRGTADDPHKRISSTLYRELALSDGVYTQTVYRKVTDRGKDQWIPDTPITPLVNDTPMDRIPFVEAPAPSGTGGLRAPPLLAAVEKNLDHLRFSADFRNALRQAGSPQHYLAGPGIKDQDRDDDGNPVPRKDQKLVMGASQVWTFGDNVADGTLTISADAVSALDIGLTRCEQQLDSLGGRFLRRQERPAESGKAKQVDYSRDTTMLEETVTEAAQALSSALGFALPWLNEVTGSLTVHPNTDFHFEPMSSEVALMHERWWEKGVIALSDLRRALREGERLPLERTDELIDDEIAAQGPGALPGSES